MPTTEKQKTIEDLTKTGIAELESENLDEALKSFKAAVNLLYDEELYSKLPWTQTAVFYLSYTHLLKARKFQKKGSEQAAIDELYESIKHGHINEFTTTLEEKRNCKILFNELLEDAESTIIHNPEKADGYMIRGFAHFLNSYHLKAHKDFEKAIELNGDLKTKHPYNHLCFYYFISNHLLLALECSLWTTARWNEMFNTHNLVNQRSNFSEQEFQNLLDLYKEYSLVSQELRFGHENDNFSSANKDDVRDSFPLNKLITSINTILEKNEIDERIANSPLSLKALSAYCIRHHSFFRNPSNKNKTNVPELDQYVQKEALIQAEENSINLSENSM